jgi:wyosine [tRNA(Phe)-imidazoG37] synthetase (radical SAM superfamily)
MSRSALTRIRSQVSDVTGSTHHLALYAHHSRTWRQGRYVYPVISRRSRGLSIGVNLNPDKVCNFDCIYCSVDRRVPAATVDVDLAVLRSELAAMLDLASDGGIFDEPPFDQTPTPLRRINDVAFSGDGEPTSFCFFEDACRLVADALEERALAETKIVVITNATLLHRPSVKSALAFLDEHRGEIWAKLDAGTEASYRRIERTTIPLARVLSNILETARPRPIVIQSLFMNIAGVGPAAAEIDAYVRRVRELVKCGAKIKLVQVYTIARPTAEKNVTPLDDHALDQIAAHVRAIGLNVEAFYGTL